jgi:hypothetical protein
MEEILTYINHYLLRFGSKFLDILYPIFKVEKSIIPPGLRRQGGHVLHLQLFTTMRAVWQKQGAY